MQMPHSTPTPTAERLALQLSTAVLSGVSFDAASAEIQTRNWLTADVSWSQVRSLARAHIVSALKVGA